jgi:hypothetical protein
MGAYTATGVTSVIENGPSVTAVGAGSIEAAISDNSDSSYVTADNAHGGALTFSMPNPVLPAGAIVHGISWELRRSVSAGSNQNNPYWLNAIIMDRQGGFNIPVTTHGRTFDGSFTAAMAWNTSIQDSYTGFFVEFPDGVHVKDMNQDSLIITLGFIPTFATPDIRLYRIRTTWWYNEPPTVTVGTHPANPSPTSRPTIEWTYTDPEGDPQRSWRAMIVPDGAVSFLWPYGYAGYPLFNPAGASEIAYDSGVRYGPFTSVATDRGLDNGRTYWAYVQAYADPVAGQAQQSTWSGKRFLVDVDGPANPNLTVTPDSTNSRVLVAAVESTTASPHPAAYDVQRSEDAGATWADVRGGSFTGAADGFYTAAAGAGWDTPDRAEFTFTNGLRFRWNGTLDDYTPATTATLAGQSRDTGTSRAWKVLVRSDGKLELQWSTSGTSWDKTATSTVAAGLSNGSPTWIEVEAVFNTNPWTVIFRVSTNGTTWTAVGATVTGTGPAAANNSTVALEAAGANGHASAMPVGTTRRVQVWNSSNVLVVDGNWVGLEPLTDDYVDSVGNTWTHTGSGDHTVMAIAVYDYEATNGVAVTYRARAYRFDVDGFAAGDWVTASPVTLSAARWWVKDPLNPSVNLPVSVVEWRRTIPKPMTVDDGIDTDTAIVVHGGVRSDRIDGKLRTLDKAAYDSLMGLLRGGRTLLVQGVLAEQWYVQNGDITLDIVHASPTPGEPFPIRHAHELNVTFVEVEAP